MIHENSPILFWSCFPLHKDGLLEVVKWLIEELHCDPNIEDDGSVTLCIWSYQIHLHHNEQRVNIQVAEYLVTNCGYDSMKIRERLSPMQINSM